MFSGFRRARAGADSAPAPPLPRHETHWVVAGLGNPGEQYHRSRHNLGFMVVDHLARARGARLDRRKFKGLLVEAEIGSQSAILVKPQTYYNLSGECVGALLGYYKIPAERLIVVHDDLDLEPGQLRLKRGGSDAGNRGVRSIAATLGTPDFVRVRIGIGRPPAGERSPDGGPGATRPHAQAGRAPRDDARDDAIDHVIHPLGRAELETFKAAIARAAEAVEAVITAGLERAMNVYNQRG